MTPGEPAPILGRMRTLLLLASATALATLAPPLTAQGDTAAAGIRTSAVSDYRLRPGDVLRIRVWGQEEFSGEFQVDERGIIEYPLLGEVDTRDLSIGALRDTVRAGLGRLFRDPFVTITPLFRMAVLGEVNRPGLYAVDPTLTVVDVVALAGGTTRSGSLGRIRVLRGGERIQFDFEESAMAGRTLSEMGVRSGDQISVGRAWITIDQLSLIFSVLQVALTTVILVRQF